MSKALYKGVLEDGDTEAMRQLCRNDLFFLLFVGCKRKDVDHDWLYERCREVEAKPDGMLDLWAREHYKSTIITFAKSLQDVLSSHGRNPDPKWQGREVTVGFFSCTRPLAKDFLKQIQRELEDNQFLKDLFPDVLFQQPKREAPLWSLDSGLVVKRHSNPREATFEAHGLVDGQPTGKHFFLLVYDDVVTRESVTTPEQIKKTTDAWALSLNLGAKGGLIRYIGTRYHYNDTYRTILEREAAEPRIHKATVDGTVNGDPVFLSREELMKKRREMGPYIFACQMLQDPKEDSVMGFKREWLRQYHELRNHSQWNFYITVDPAGEKKKDNDYTVMWVHGLAPDGNYYLVDAVRDRMNLTQRCDALMRLHKKWRPLKVGYEKYGLQADIEHIEYVMELKNYRFVIVPLGGAMSKNDRIRRLVPIFEQGRYYLPVRLMFLDSEKKPHDFVQEFIDDEYEAFPVAIHDDMLDCASRIVDPDLRAEFPEEQEYHLSMTMAPDRGKVQTEYKLFA